MINNNKVTGGLVAFVVAPFATAIYAVTKAGEKWTYLVLALFTALFGYCAIPDETMDFYRYLHLLDYFSWTDTSEFGTDKYVYFVTGLVSNVTRNGHILMAVFGAIYGLLFAMSLQFFTDKEKGLPKYVYLFFVMLFANALSLKGLGGVRFGTATFMFFIGVYNYIITKNYKFLILIALSPLVHFSFILYDGIFLAFYFSKKYPRVIVYAFLISFILNVANVGSFFSQYSMYFGSDIAERGSDYINGDLDEMKKTYQGAFWTRIGIYFRYCEYFVLIFIYKHAKKHHGKINFGSDTGLMFLFCLVFGIFGNIFEPVPHLGLRTQGLFSSFLILPIFRYCRDNWQYQDLTMRLMTCIIMACGFLKIIIGIRTVTDITPVSLVFCPLPLTQITDTTMNVLFGL